MPIYLKPISNSTMLSKGGGHARERGQVEVTPIKPSVLLGEPQLEHIQLKLVNKRGIRLEGYADLEQLGCAIADQIPKEQVVGREY